MATKRIRRLVSYTDEEMEQIKTMCEAMKLDFSELHRRLVLGHRLPDPQNFEKSKTIRELLQANADQARLGNLLKLTLDQLEDDFDPTTMQKLNGLIDEIHTTRETFKATAMSLHKEMHPRAQ